MVKIRYSVPYGFLPHREHRSKKNKKNIGGIDGKFYRLRKKKKLEDLKKKDLENN